MTCNEYLDLAAADVDEQLTAEERLAADTHLAGCQRCRALRDIQARVKTHLRRPTLQSRVPEDLFRRVTDALHDERDPVKRPAPQTRSWRRRVLVVGAIAATLVLLLFPLRVQQEPDLVAILSANVKAAEAQELSFDIEANDPEALRRYYKQVTQLPFEQTVTDLSSAGFHPVGGSVSKIGNVPATLTLYRGASGSILCRRFAAGALAMPAGGESFEFGMLYSEGNVTIWIHRDGDATCCLVTTMPRAEFLNRLQAAMKHS